MNPGLSTQRRLAHYFEYSSNGIEIIDEGLQEMTFGEFLVQQKAINREQLLLALQHQDQHPNRRIGECIASLGYVTYPDIESYLEVWHSMDVVLV